MESAKPSTHLSHFPHSSTKFSSYFTSDSRSTRSLASRDRFLDSPASTRRSAHPRSRRLRKGFLLRRCSSRRNLSTILRFLPFSRIDRFQRYPSSHLRRFNSTQSRRYRESLPRRMRHDRQRISLSFRTQFTHFRRSPLSSLPLSNQTSLPRTQDVSLHSSSVL